MTLGRRGAIWRSIKKKTATNPGPLDTKCWIWTGSNSGNGRGGGYPRMSLSGATMAVHRVMYMIVHGPIPPRKQIDHICKNRMCVRPSHLEMVTHKENQRRKK